MGVGYCSYSLYTSEAWRRRKQQIVRLVKAFSLLSDAAHEGAESAALISSDLKHFLRSDEDELPRSLRQALKLAHSPDVQHSCTLLSAALTRGLLRGFALSCPPSFPPVIRNRSNVPPEDLSCKEIKEICHISCSGSSGSHKRGGQYTEDWQELGFKSSRRVGSTVEIEGRRHQKGSKQQEELPERLLGKLFSEPGVNFASAVVGSVACNIVKALFDGFESQHVSQTRNDRPDSCGDVNKGKSTESVVVDVLCTKQCRGLIAESIQTLVTTAVSVYIEKTKDINFYHDMVAGIINPAHKDPMKDLLTSVCNGAIETLVKTSHHVMFAKASGVPRANERLEEYPEEGRWAAEESPNEQGVQSQLSLFNPCISQSVQHEGMIDACSSLSSEPMALKRGMKGPLQGSKETASCEMPQRGNEGVHSLIDEVSKTLAIPSNRKLVVDVAGTMTSEAVRSFVNVIISTVSSNLRRSKLGAWMQEGDGGALQCQSKYKETAIKSFVLASICLAICLHMLSGIHLWEKI